MSLRRSLQTVLVLLGLFVLGTGVLDVVAGPAALPGHPEVSTTVDSNYRFFAGVWSMLGLVLLGLARRVQTNGPGLRVVFAAVFLGGLARLVSFLTVGAPHPLHTAFIGVELLLPPLLLVWHSRVARSRSQGVF
ncbi:hypothetical protein SUDANB105_07863 [Streptomyces sp. enrichment culture]|uniref:DUF4345 domain-containing protein n=1 Tax=Streptomyces sp. enrichment culture TaxID=1795815 RepID=UPI003F547CCE